jgi:hypothetical protein
MIDQATIKRRDMLLAASSILAATAISVPPAVAQTQMPAGSKSESQAPPPTGKPDDSDESPSRGRRFS